MRRARGLGGRLDLAEAVVAGCLCHSFGLAVQSGRLDECPVLFFLFDLRQEGIEFVPGAGRRLGRPFPFTPGFRVLVGARAVLAEAGDPFLCLLGPVGDVLGQEFHCDHGRLLTGRVRKGEGVGVVAEDGEERGRVRGVAGDVE